MMKWYYQIRGGHAHVRVFVNGANCGDLCFRNVEFDVVRIDLAGHVIFIPDTILLTDPNSHIEP